MADSTDPVLEHTLHGHSDGITCLSVAGTMAVSGCNDGSLKAWDIARGSKLKSFKGHDEAVWTVHIEGDVIYSGSGDRTCRVWRPDTKNPLQIFEGHRRAIFALAYGNETLFSASEDKTVFKHGEPLQVFKGHKKTVSCLEIVGNVLYSGSWDHSIRAWDVEADQCIKLFKGHTDLIYAIKVVDGVLYSVSRDGTARAWNTSSSDCLVTFAGHTSRVVCLEVHNDHLFTGSSDSTVRMWDVSTGTCLAVLEGHTGAVLCMAKLPGVVFSAGNDGDVRAWSVETGDPLAVMSGHSDYVMALETDGRSRVVSGSRDKSINVWDVSALVQHHSAESASTVHVRLFLTDGTHKSTNVPPDTSVAALMAIACELFEVPEESASNWAIWEASAQKNTGDRRLFDTEVVVRVQGSWNDDKHNMKFLFLDSTQQARTGTVARRSSIAPGAETSPTKVGITSTSNGGSVEVLVLQRRNESLQAEIQSLKSQLAVSGMAGGGGGGEGGSSGGGGASAAELQAAQAQIGQVREELATQEAAKRMAENRVEELEGQVATIQRELQVQKDLASTSATDQVATLEAAHAETVAQLQATAAEKQAAAAAEAERLNGELTAARNELADVNTQLSSARARVSELEETVRTMEANVAELRDVAAHASELRDRVTALEATQAQYEEEAIKYREMYNTEHRQRIKYHNQVEDMKGKIRVYCRKRPMSGGEMAEGYNDCVTMLDEERMEIVDPDESKRNRVRPYTFTRVFHEHTSQEDIFEDCKHLMESAIAGYNVCIFAYGQTGSGKTYTMGGEPGNEGITPRACREIWDIINRDADRFDTTVAMYMMELYNDQFLDLLLDPEIEDRPTIEVHQDGRGTVHVDNVVVREAHSADEMLAIIDEGSEHRHTASTLMNSESSRSHLIVMVLIQSTSKINGQHVEGKLALVDLAGSERVDRSGVSGEGLKEAQSINSSLSALGDVIAALTQAGGPRGHIPYRNNKLTKLMADSLGGTAKTLMFVNVSPSDSNFSETNNSLQYATRVGSISNEVNKNVDSKEIKRLKAIIADLKRR